MFGNLRKNMNLQHEKIHLYNPHKKEPKRITIL